jgi:hypothetical protein
MKSARFTYYTPRTYADRQLHTHKSDIHEIIFFEASVELNDNEILSTCFYVYAKLLYLSHIYRRRILFLIYQFQFLSLCHSREDEDIPKNSGRCHSSRPSLTSLIPSSSHTPLVNRCKHKMQVALFFKTSFRQPGHSSPMERNSFPEASK